MPTYEYRCRDCGQHVEVVQSFRDDPLTQCGNCGGRLRKVFGAAGIIFKGSGYYVNDSRKAPAAKTGDKGEQPAGSETKEPAAEKGKTEKDKKDGPKARTAPAGGGKSAPTAESA